jgi:hypothetical protein
VLAGGGSAGRAAGGGGATGTGGLTMAGADASVADSAAAAGDGGSVDLGGAVYVAATGDDSSPGTLSRPVRTLAKARDIVRTLNSAMKADVTVYIRGGTYPLTDTLTFANADSGTGGFYVKYVAYPGEQPLITGGQPIEGWTLSDSSKGIYSAAGVKTPFRQLYVNGVKAIRARSPNLGTNGEPVFDYPTGYDTNAHTIKVPSSVVSQWNNFTKVEMHMIVAWADNTLRLASYTTSGSTASLKIQSPEDGILYVRPNPPLWNSKEPYYFENALEFLDQPGEWYLDETTNVLYYKPRTGEDMTTATVVAPMIETLVNIHGTSTTQQAGYLWFQGLTFAHSTWMRPSQYGFLDAQGGEYNITAPANNAQTIGRPASGVTVTNANHIHFERNIFTQMAATGLDFISGTHDDMVIGNVFTDIAGIGISVAKFAVDEKTDYHTAYNPSDVNEICTNETIKDNYIHHVTTEFWGACGIAGGYPRNIDIEHNEVAYVNYHGISVGFGWTGATNAMSNNCINFNNIHHIAQILGDCGAIYLLSNQMPKSQMMSNYMHDFSLPKWADNGIQSIYMDEQTDGFTVQHNVMVNCPTEVHQHATGSHNTISDNGPNTTNAAQTIANAGIEAAYADIKTLKAPLPSF